MSFIFLYFISEKEELFIEEIMSVCVRACIMGN